MTYEFRFKTLDNKDESYYETYEKEKKLMALATEQSFAFVRILKTAPEWALYDTDSSHTVYIKK